MADYYALIGRHEGGFVAFFPDLLGCNVFALKMREAVVAARDVLRERLGELERTGQGAPSPSSLLQVWAHPANVDSHAILICTEKIDA
jgi:predicted RNase H-like HicB family nuclease